MLPREHLCLLCSDFHWLYVHTTNSNYCVSGLDNTVIFTLAFLWHPVSSALPCWAHRVININLGALRVILRWYLSTMVA